MLKYHSFEEIFGQKEKVLKKGLDKYINIMTTFKKINIADNLEFQKTFRNFYKISHRINEFYIEYFKYFEGIKNDTNIDFKTILTNINSFSGYLEMSFSSKILHTINPDYPIWDSVVTKGHFEIEAPKESSKYDRIIEAVKKYNMYKDKFYEFMNSTEGKKIITAFDNYFPDSKISDAKKIDFILWQDRKEK